nr:MAG TPA: hypothetical protein [Herelleviridae sp.]
MRLSCLSVAFNACGTTSKFSLHIILLKVDKRQPYFFKTSLRTDGKLTYWFFTNTDIVNGV